MSRLALYKIENGFYITPAIEIYWEEGNRLGLSIMWLNRDMTLWLREENKKEKEYATRNPVDPFGEHFSHHKSAAEEKIKFPRR
tara:strand:- start:1650 stop:1901 length:252 start_codon:yes stop_codon:yes gene_type:complete